MERRSRIVRPLPTNDHAAPCRRSGECPLALGSRDAHAERWAEEPGYRTKAGRRLIRRTRVAHESDSHRLTQRRRAEVKNAELRTRLEWRRARTLNKFER